MSTPKNSVWAAMSYMPPRGPCNYKSSLMSPACPCLRFMLHPIKAASSFECDGCNHHASFHSLENPSEDAVLKKWAATEEQTKESRKTITVESRKRRKLLTQSVPESTPAVYEVESETETTSNVEQGDEPVWNPPTRRQAALKSQQQKK